MLTKVVPREAAEPIQPIEWPSVNAEFPPKAEARARDTADAGELARLRNEVASLRTELQGAREEAVRQSAEALAQGRHEGEASTRQALEAKLQAETSRLGQMISDVMAAGPRLRHHAEEDLVKLAVAIARRILHREVSVDADTMLGLIKAALSRLDQREIHHVRTDPDSKAVVERVLREASAERPVKIIVDSSLKRGSLLIETDRGQLDASIETQLLEIQRGFADLVHHS